MELSELGWDLEWDAAFSECVAAPAPPAPRCVPARICAESRGLYRVRGAAGEWQAEIAGRLRFAATAGVGQQAAGRRQPVQPALPAVGDWVAAMPRGAGRATIVAVLPRRTQLVRKAAGPGVAAQVLAANLDTVFVVGSLNQELNLRRIERYLAVVWEGGARPVVLLNKADLDADPQAACARVAAATAAGAPVCAVSAASGAGLERLHAWLGRGRTAAFVGSSGVGKSTLINALLGQPELATGTIRAGDDRGRHTTTTRQLLVLPGGGVLIDTPGLRELQLWDGEAGLARAFGDVAALADGCRFRDCRHRGEPGCAVAGAIASGALPRERLDHHRKLAAELAHVAARSDGAAQRDRKQHAKLRCKEYRRLVRERRSWRD